nr:hypothetical protein [Tanacetum cinerariifolium]
MPFVEIVGVASTRKTFCIAFAFISEEKEKNYKWVLERLKLTFEGFMHPRVIITDRELALINAYENVFSKATRLLCRWHIHQNIIKHCRKMIKPQCDWDSFYSTWKLLEDSPTWISYMENYKQLHLVLRKYPRALSYLDEQWLNNHKEKFVSAWADQSLNFEINASFGRSTTYRYHQHNLSIFTLLRSHVSKEALDLILKELLRLDDPEFDHSMCGCRLRNSCGLPCACVLLMYLNSGEYIPLDSIDIFWRTLNVSWTDPVENEDILCEIRPSLKKQQEKKHAGPKTQDLGKRSYSCRFFDIDPNMQPTRHSSVSNFQTGRTFNLIPDLNKEPSRHNSFVSQTSTWHDSSIDEQIEIERLRKQIPKVVHPYILVSGIQNVGSDGNCGFRAVALGLGLPKDHWPRIRSDLVRELEARQRQYTYIFGTIGYQKIYSTVKFAGRWMEMPDTGLVIASTYNKVVANLSDAGGCNTSFPLWSRPPQTESHVTIVVAHVDGNHYIRVALREGFPLPLIHPLWITYRSDVASGWKDKFELAEYINTLSWNRPAFYNNGDDDDEDCTIAVTPDFPITDSLIMENEHLDTIPETESDEFIKSSVENLVSIPSESEYFSNIESECDMPNCDDSQTTNFLTFSNPLFDDSTSSDDESSHEEVIHEMSFKTYSNPLFDLDEEIISSEFNPIHIEDLDSTPKNDCFDTKSYLLKSLLNHDESIPSVVQYSQKHEDYCQRILSSKSSFPQLQLGINLLHLAGLQPMLKSSYKAEDGVIISIPPLVGGVADVVDEMKST